MGEEIPIFLNYSYNNLYASGLSGKAKKVPEKTDKEKIKSVVCLDTYTPSTEAQEPQTKSFSITDVWNGFTMFLGLKKAATKAVTILKGNIATPEQKEIVANKLIDLFGRKGVFTQEEVDHLKTLSLDQKKELIAELTKKINKESTGAKQLLIYTTNSELVFANLTPVENSDGEIKKAKVEFIRVSQGKVTLLITEYLTKMNAPDLTNPQANELSENLVCLRDVTKKDTDFIFENHSIMPKDVLEKTDQNIQAIKQNAIELIKVAADKGFKLDNIDQIASIARETTEPESVAAPVPLTAGNLLQWNVLNKIKLEFSKMLEAVNKLLRENREENKSLDKAAAEKKAQSNAEEAKYIKVAMLKKDELKKLINIIQDKKLQNKLNAVVIVLSYLLKNPDQISEALLGSLKDEIKYLTTPKPFA